jgi:hypothetical protein
MKEAQVYAWHPPPADELEESPFSIRWRSHSRAAISQCPNSSSEVMAILLLLPTESNCPPAFGIPCIGRFPITRLVALPIRNLQRR